MTTETVPPSSTAASIGSVALLAESWRLSLEAANRSPKTINTYTTGLELFSRFLIERGMPTEVSSIIREHVESSQKWMFDEGYRPASVRNRHQALQAFFKWALEDGEISASPMVNIPPPQVPEAPPAVLSEDDVAALLNTCEGKGFEDRRDLAIIRIFYSVGLRLSELSNLTIDDVDLRDKTLKVLGKGRRPRMVGYGMKVAQGDRSIPEGPPGAPLRRAPEPVARQEGRDDGLWRSPDARAARRARRDRPLARALVQAHLGAHGDVGQPTSETDIMTTAGWRSARMLSSYGASRAQERAQQAQHEFDHGNRL